MYKTNPLSLVNQIENHEKFHYFLIVELLSEVHSIIKTRILMLWSWWWKQDGQENCGERGYAGHLTVPRRLKVPSHTRRKTCTVLLYQSLLMPFTDDKLTLWPNISQEKLVNWFTFSVTINLRIVFGEFAFVDTFGLIQYMKKNNILGLCNNCLIAIDISDLEENNIWKVYTAFEDQRWGVVCIALNIIHELW